MRFMVDGLLMHAIWTRLTPVLHNFYKKSLLYFTFLMHKYS